MKTAFNIAVLIYFGWMLVDAIYFSLFGSSMGGIYYITGYRSGATDIAAQSETAVNISFRYLVFYGLAWTIFARIMVWVVKGRGYKPNDAKFKGVSRDSKVDNSDLQHEVRGSDKEFNAHEFIAFMFAFVAILPSLVVPMVTVDVYDVEINRLWSLSMLYCAIIFILKPFYNSIQSKNRLEGSYPHYLDKGDSED